MERIRNVMTHPNMRSNTRQYLYVATIPGFINIRNNFWTLACNKQYRNTQERSCTFEIFLTLNCKRAGH